MQARSGNLGGHHHNYTVPVNSISDICKTDPFFLCKFLLANSSLSQWVVVLFAELLMAADQAVLDFSFLYPIFTRSSDSISFSVAWLWLLLPLPYCSGPDHHTLGSGLVQWHREWYLFHTLNFCSDCRSMTIPKQVMSIVTLSLRTSRGLHITLRI